MIGVRMYKKRLARACRYLDKLSLVLVLTLQFAPLCAQARGLNGTIHITDDDFVLEARAATETATVTTNNYADFSLAFAAASGDAAFKFYNKSNNQIDEAEYGVRIQADTVYSDSDTVQTIEIVLERPGTIEWYPTVDTSRGYRKVRYKTLVSARTFQFSPAVILTLTDKDTGQSRTTSEPVARVDITGDATVAFSSSSIRERANVLKLVRSNGFKQPDDFLLASEGRPLDPPSLGRGRAIRFVALESAPVDFRVYYPSGSDKHILGFFSDREMERPTDVSGLEIDGKQLLTTEIVVDGASTVRVPKNWMYPIITRDTMVIAPISVRFADAGVSVLNVDIQSQSADLLDFVEDRPAMLIDKSATEVETRAIEKAIPDLLVSARLDALREYQTLRPIDVVRSGELVEQGGAKGDTLAAIFLRRKLFTPSLHYPIVDGSKPLKILMRVRVSGRSETGQYRSSIRVTAANGFARDIPVGIESFDPLGTAKQAAVGLVGTLFTGFVGWMVLDRRRRKQEGFEDCVASSTCGQTAD